MMVPEARLARAFPDATPDELSLIFACAQALAVLNRCVKELRAEHRRIVLDGAMNDLVELATVTVPELAHEMGESR